MLKKLKFPWFGRTGIIIYPVALPGLLISLAVVAYLIFSFIDIDNRSHSASDTLRPFIIRFIIIYILYFIFALVTGLTNEKKVLTTKDTKVNTKEHKGN